MMRLHINIDHVATLRQARRTDEPDPVRAAVLAELGGADGITVHLREDRRHIQDRDLRLLLATVRSGVNLELAAASDVVRIALEIRPREATLVPERREEITTEGGLALGEGAARKKLAAALEDLKRAGIRTSLFIDPEPASIRAAAELGTDAIELHTGEYAHALLAAKGRLQADRRRADTPEEELDRIRRGAVLARSLGLDVHAGHGLTYENVMPVAAVAEIEELNIGHSVVSRAVLVGMERAVREMKDLLRQARTTPAGAREQ
ncbi:MAG: pyridoxine 5'-phosphate synthase [Gemmatimonadetes bacterium]|nr:pyridoxine 5'-phosphate synthase [Gemmatimonadota bacterium]